MQHWRGSQRSHLLSRRTTACGLAGVCHWTHTCMHIRTHVNQHQRHCKKISLDLVAYIQIDAMTQYHPCCNVFFFLIYWVSVFCEPQLSVAVCAEKCCECFKIFLLIYLFSTSIRRNQNVHNPYSFQQFLWTRSLGILSALSAYTTCWPTGNCTCYFR